MTNEEKYKQCMSCRIRKVYASMDFHFDWHDCPYVCEKIKEET